MEEYYRVGDLVEVVKSENPNYNGYIGTIVKLARNNSDIGIIAVIKTINTKTRRTVRFYTWKLKLLQGVEPNWRV